MFNSRGSVVSANRSKVVVVCLFECCNGYVMRKPVLPYANNKGADQPVHQRSLISTFVVRFLDSTISLVSILAIS